jgi:hypothetical protein
VEPKGSSRRIIHGSPAVDVLTPGYDVLVLNDQTNWSEDQRFAVRAVEAGQGFVLLHYSVGDNQDGPWCIRN